MVSFNHNLIIITNIVISICIMQANAGPPLPKEKTDNSNSNINGLKSMYLFIDIE